MWFAPLLVAFSLPFIALAQTGIAPCTPGTASCPALPPAYGGTFKPSECINDGYYDGMNRGSVSSIQQCFNVCRFSRFAIVARPFDGDCFCSDNVKMAGNPVQTALYQPAACSANNYAVYVHSQSAASQGLSRREERINARKRALKAAQLCPKSLTACYSSPLQTDYECLPIESELESCGGCIYGAPPTGLSDEGSLQFLEARARSGRAFSIDAAHEAIQIAKEDSTKRSLPPSGVDCSSLPGVEAGSITCLSSQCVAYRCKRGWVLRDDACHRE